MSGDTFAVGEVARLVAYRRSTCAPITRLTRYFGTEVVIDSRPIWSDDYVNGVGYEVITHDGNRFDVGAVCLHKNPPDWVKLCHLNEIPSEECVCL